MLAILAESALRSLVLGSVVWAGLNLLRVRNPHMHMTSWAMVLVASLSMPLLMHWTTVTVAVAALPVPRPENLWPAAVMRSVAGAIARMLPAERACPPRSGAHRRPVNWLALATVIYALIAGVLLLRLAVGLYLTWRLVRAAKPMREPWAADWTCA